MDFRVGDQIIMTETANHQYGITKAGSIGTIVRIDSGRNRHGTHEVKFSKIVNGDIHDERYYIGKEYWVFPKYFELVERLTNQERVIRKIRQMDKRFADNQEVKKQFKGDYNYAA